MIDKCFYKNVGPFTLSDIALKLNLDFSGDPNFKIKDIATLDFASSNEISFFHKKKVLTTSFYILDMVYIGYIYFILYG